MILKHIPKFSLPDTDTPQDALEKEESHALHSDKPLVRIPSYLTPMSARIAVFSGPVGIMLGFGLVYIMTFAVLWVPGDWQHLLLALSIAPILIWLSEHDLRTYELPDVSTAVVAIIAVVFLADSDPQALPLHLVTGLCVTGFLWGLGSVYFLATGVDGFGIGDAKLFGAGALLLGPWQLPELMLLASCGGIVGYWIAHRRSSTVPDGIPFGPYIAYAIFVLSFLTPVLPWTGL